MKIVSLIQGSKEWHKHREECDNASEAAAALGLDKEVMRDELIRQYATGEKKEVSLYVKDVIFKDGHEKEDLARVILERELGEELYPIVGVKENLSASFDGLTILETICFEHKQWDKELAEMVSEKILPDSHMPQLQQQLMISGAEKVIFVVSDGTLKKRVMMDVFPDNKWFERIKAGWIQFHKDVDDYKPVEIVIEPIVKKVEALPALNVEITGGVTASNFRDYEKNALAFIGNINTVLQTDSDFANADAVVKFCGKTEKELDKVKQAALEQTADIADLFKMIDMLKAEMRDKRLELNKLVKARKDAIRGEIIGTAKHKLADFVMYKNSDMPQGIGIVFNDADFEGVVKNKRTVASLHNAVNTELARCKTEIIMTCDRMLGNHTALYDIASSYGFLFNDIQQIITKDREDLLNLAKQRIADHKVEEERKLEAERERMRIEMEAEHARIRKKEEAKEKAKVEAQQRLDHEAKQKEGRAQVIAKNKLLEEVKEKAKEKAKVEAQQLRIAANDKRVNTENITVDINESETPFDIWWRNFGSVMGKSAREDHAEHVARVACTAWHASKGK